MEVRPELAADRGGATPPGHRPRVRDPRGRAERRGAGRGRAVRPVDLRPHGRAGADRGAAARGRRWVRLQLRRLDARHGGAGRGRHGERRDAERPHPVAVPGRDLGHGRAARALAGADDRGREAGRVRADGAPCRLRRRLAPDPRRAGRRRLVPADRLEDLDLERARGRSLPRVRDARPVGRPAGDHRVPRREGFARVHVRGPREEDGHPVVPGRGADLRRLPSSRPRTASARRAAATRSRCRGSPRAGSRSPRRAWGSPAPRSSRRPGTSASGGRSVRRWRSSRASGSWSRRWLATSRRHGR